MMLIKKFVQPEYLVSCEWAKVDSIGTQLYEYLSRPEIYKHFNIANQPGKHSSSVQDIFLDYAEKLGFISEKKDLFSNYPTSALRPDYYLKIKESGILLEVERGKTVMNNMDLLDLWKCHICVYADYLFLMVPIQLKQNNSDKGKKVFENVVNRMSPFFQERNYTNVRALIIYGY